MTQQYSPGTPVSRQGDVKVGYPPAKVALVTTHKENTSASSILLLGHNTTEVEVTPTTADVAGKWLSQTTVDSSVAGTSVITAAGSSNFDFVVRTASPRRFVVPIAFQGNSASIQGVNRAEGLYPALALKTLSTTAGSVVTMEF